MEKTSIKIPDIIIRNIAIEDNEAIAKIIRMALTEFGANKPGTVYYDSTTDHLFELFQTPGAIYFIAEFHGEIVGGSGIFPTVGLPEKTCELVKLYLHKDVRGIGLGKQLLLKSMQWAKENGYDQVYLESMPELSKAVSIYENVGFKKIHHALGNSGHDGCDIWMIKTL
ncbi:MAG: GNAT family N-acetyltransferase [Sediminibacterium sp.]